MILTLRIVFHLSPLIPFIWNRHYLAVAMLLLLATCYIKTLKLEQFLKELDSGSDQEEKESIERLKNRWKSLTFL